MLTAKLVRLEIIWSATPQPRRRTARAGSFQRAATRERRRPGSAVSVRVADSVAMHVARGDSVRGQAAGMRDTCEHTGAVPQMPRRPLHAPPSSPHRTLYDPCRRSLDTSGGSEQHPTTRDLAAPAGSPGPGPRWADQLADMIRIDLRGIGRITTTRSALL